MEVGTQQEKSLECIISAGRQRREEEGEREARSVIVGTLGMVGRKGNKSSSRNNRQCGVFKGGLVLVFLSFLSSFFWDWKGRQGIGSAVIEPEMALLCHSAQLWLKFYM